MIGVCYNIALANSLDVGFLLAYIASGLLGGMTGYVMLIAVNKLNTVRKNERLTRFLKIKCFLPKLYGSKMRRPYRGLIFS